MVCLGNICRSPMAQGIMEHEIKKLGLNWYVDSAGTNGFHNGESPDPRAILLMKKHGIDISRQISRKITIQDWNKFDKIYCLDDTIFKECRLFFSGQQIDHKLSNWSALFTDNQFSGVIDPYYNNRFQEAYDSILLGIKIILDQNAREVFKT